MTRLVEARGLSKSYGSVNALDSIDLDVDEGRIVGLIGPNGAGKTTALKAILGLTPFDGALNVLGYDPRRQRHRMMQHVCFIADVATLPRWLRVNQALDYVAAVHPRFNRERAEQFLSKTEIKKTSKIRSLSKGMVTQLHLSLTMAIDARLLVLDEPTIGLDIVTRKDFYSVLLEDYFDEKRTIIITTHQVEEIEHILTDLVFINHGRIVLNETMDRVADKFIEVMVNPDNTKRARELTPCYEREVFGRSIFLFDGVNADRLRELGETRTPSVADLFVAKIKGAAA